MQANAPPTSLYREVIVLGITVCGFLYQFVLPSLLLRLSRTKYNKSNVEVKLSLLLNVVNVEGVII